MSRGGRLAIGIGLALIGLVLIARRQAAKQLGPPITAVPSQKAADMAKRKTKSHGDPGPYLVRVRAAVARHPELAGRLHVYLGLLDQESRFDPKAESPTGAAGLAQFTSVGRAEVRRLMAIPKYSGRYVGTGNMAEKLRTYDRTGALTADVAIEAGALYLASLLETYGYNVEAALTAYNGGGRPARLVQQAGTHAAALPALLLLPANQRSQSDVYAPEVLVNARFFQSQNVA